MTITARLYERDTATPAQPSAVSIPYNASRGGTAADGALRYAFGMQWREAISQPGYGQLSVAMDDEARPLLTPGRLIRFYDGSTLCFSFIIQAQARQLVSPDEEYGEAVTVGGPGVLAVLHDAVAYPDRELSVPSHASMLRFDWTSDAYSAVAGVGGWVAAVVTAEAGNFAPPGSWPGGGSWIWSEDSAVADVPAGDCFFRNLFTLASDTVLGIAAAADDTFQVTINNEDVPELSEDQFYAGQSKSAIIPLKAGTHIIAARVRNLGVGRAGLKMVGWSLGSDKQPVALLWATDATWEALGYPATAPGLLVGEVVRELFARAVLRGTVGDVGIDGFTDTDDTDGNPYTVEGDISVPIMGHLDDVLAQLCATYCEVRMTPALGLRLYNPGGMGTASGITWRKPTDPADPTTGNITEWQVSNDDQRHANSLLVRWSGGYFVEEDAPDIAASGRREAGFDCHDIVSEDEARRRARAELDHDGVVRWKITAGIEPSSADRPYVPGGIQMGDTSTGLDENAAAKTVRMVGIAVNVADEPAGVPAVTYAPTFEYVES